MAKTTRSGIAVRVAATLLALSFWGCDFTSPTESNPNAVPSASVDQLFTGIQVNSFFVAEGQLSRLAAVWTQQMTGTDAQFSTLDRYVLTEEDASGEFSAIYTGGGLVDLKNAIAQAEDASRLAYAGILKIHQAYMFGMAASLWGDIPYSEAADPTITSPKLDDQAAVYDAVQELLDAAVADLSAGTGAGPGAVDMNFAGDAVRWIAVAHTLKARYHMHWGEVKGPDSYQSALAEAQQGIVTNSGNWRAIHSTVSSENNIWFQFMRDRGGLILAGDFLVPSMVTRDDPRLPFYFSPSSSDGFQARASGLSTESSGYGASDFNTPIATCAEAAYIRAEAQHHLGNQPAARAAAKDGLACEEARLGVTLSTQNTLLDAAAGQALLDEIMLQKYTALFLNTEIWNDWKRTCLPRISQCPGGVPGRLFYGQAERQSNENIPETSAQPSRNDNDPDPCA